jgi:hypothetical protein
MEIGRQRFKADWLREVPRGGEEGSRAKARPLGDHRPRQPKPGHAHQCARDVSAGSQSLATATPEQLDAAARITPQDIERAKAAARLYGTPLLNAMLDAEAAPARKPRRSQ